MKVLIDKGKNFYKANLHCHTVNSDGALTPEQVKEMYKGQGYSIIAYTDHEHILDHSDLNDDNFLTIPSAELAIKQYPRESTLKNYNMKVTHLNVYAIDPTNLTTPCYSSLYDYFIPRLPQEVVDKIKYEEDYNRVYSKHGINEIIKIAKEKGFLVSYNHPTWSLENATDYLNYENLDFVEIYNHECTVTGRFDDEHVFDDMLRAGKKLWCTCCDDNHNGNYKTASIAEQIGGYTMINADKLDYSTIINALKNGDFYASYGPEIYSLTLDNKVVTIETSPATCIRLTTRGRRAMSIRAKEGELVTKAQFELTDKDEYFRITVEDQNGKKGFTQAYSVNE